MHVLQGRLGKDSKINSEEIPKWKYRYKGNDPFYSLPWQEFIKLNLEGSKASDSEKNEILEEIKKERAAAADIPHEEWVSKLVEKYKILRAITMKNLPNLWSPLEFALSIKTILNIKDCTLPFAWIILGPPSSLKTAVIELFRKWPQTYYTDNFSAKAFVSHSTAVSKEQLAKIECFRE